MKRKSKTQRRRREQKGGSTRQMAIRFYIDPEASERVHIHDDMTEQQFRILLGLVGDYLQTFSTAGGEGFMLRYPNHRINYEENEPDSIFTHVRVLLPQRQTEEINFPPGLSHRLEQVLLPVDVEGARYYATFSHA